LTSQEKPILKPQVPSVEVVMAIRPKISHVSGNEVMSTGTHVERCWSGAKDFIIDFKCKSCHSNYSCHGWPTKAFTKALPPKVGA